MKKKSLCRNTLKIILAVSLLTLPVHMTAAADFSDGFQNSENENFSDSHESSEYANSEDVTEETTEENELSLEDTTDTDDIPLENFSENSYDELNNSFNAGNETSAGNSSSYSDKNISCNLSEDGTTITITGNDVYLRHDIVNPLINSDLDSVPSLFLYNGGKCRIFPFYRQHSLFLPVILTLDGLTVHDGKEPLSPGFSEDQFL